MMEILVSWLQQGFKFAAFLALAALGEMIIEKSGSLNLGTPGTMCVGAASGFISVFLYANSVAAPNPLVLILLALTVAFLSAMLMGLVFGFFTVTLRINQNVIGLIMTIFGTGLAKFLSDFFVKTESGNARCQAAFEVFTAKIPFLSDSLGFVSKVLFNYGFLFYLTIVLAIGVALFFKKTRTGLNLRAVGENPATADAAGINVTAYKYGAILVGSGIAGLGGFFYIMDYIKGSWENAATIEALGWLSVALVIFTLWKPNFSIIGALIFAALYIAAYFINGNSTQKELLKLIPYVMTVLVLIATSIKGSKNNQAPASLGLSYFREER